MTIGVIGVGVVGEAVLKGFGDRGVTTFGYDKFKTQYNQLDEMVEKADVIFICVPTATAQDGMQVLEPLEETFRTLQEKQFKGVICVKSTVLPGTVGRLAVDYGFRAQACHNPEFLTAAKPYEDFMKQPVILVGGPMEAVVPVAKAYHEAQFDRVICYKDSATTELAKYTHNCFLSVKVSFMNEIYEVCQNLGIKFDDVREAALEVGQIGAGHTKVPGPDGSLGFGGMCFPKDTKAMLTFAKKMNWPMEVLEGAVVGNKRRRPTE